MTEESIKSLKRISVIGLILLVAALLISSIEKKSNRVISDLFIDIAPLPDSSNLINRGDIMLTIERSFGHQMIGIRIGEINVERVERVLEDDPFVMSANVHLNAKNQVNIEITQREPILRIIDKDGLSYYLDKHGEKMPLSKHFTTRVLVATGNIPSHVPEFMERKQHVLKDLFTMTLQILKDEFLQPFIEQVYVDGKKEYTLIPKIGKQKILMGKCTDLDNKFSRMKTFYNEGIPYAGWQKYSTVNLKYKGQVVCKKR